MDYTKRPTGDNFNKDIYFDWSQTNQQTEQSRWVNTAGAHKEKDDFDRLLRGEKTNKYNFDNIVPFKAPKRKAGTPEK